jgi:AmmeMemoRadiSam system protein A
MNLSPHEKEQLKQLARQTIENVFFGKDKGKFEPTETLKEKRGAFVTIKKKDQLRGCIGYLKGVLPLYETIREMAIQAAFSDPRFSPLQKNEWEDIDIEISVLTPLKKMSDVSEIEVGVHGLYIEKGPYSGLLLPQVATEHHWDSITFLENTCYKAGLQKDAWKSKDAVIYIFSADVF